MTSVTCSHPDGCTCDYFREELEARADLSPGGSCYKCHHDIACHPRRPSGKSPIYFADVNNLILFSLFFYIPFL